MNKTHSFPRSSSSTATLPVVDEFDEMLGQLKEAYPSATDKLLSQAIAESRKELGESNNREQLLRCVRERITA